MGHRKHPWRLHVKKGALQAIKVGRKRLLVRLDERILIRHHEGEAVTICSGDYACTCLVTAIRRYSSLESLLEYEDLEALDHGDRKTAEDYLVDTFGDIPEGKQLIALEITLIRRGQDVPRAKHNK
jgi:ASC-1-like (ASCH) protein